MNNKKEKPKRGQLYAAKYRGKNGDLILGQVLKVKGKKVTLRNLITDEISVKAISVLQQRCWKTGTFTMDAILCMHEASGDAQKAREVAVLRRKVEEDMLRDVQRKSEEYQVRENKEAELIKEIRILSIDLSLKTQQLAVLRGE